MKKKLLKVIATVIACLGVGAFVFGGCAKKGGTEGSGTQGSGTEGSGSEGSGSEGSGSEDNPSGGGEDNPSGGGEDNPSGGGEDNPSGGGEDNPSGGGEDNPSGGGEDNPSGGGEDNPSGGGEDNPSGGGEDNPSGGGEDNPSGGGEDNPSGGGQDNPSSGGDKEEEKPVINEPVEGGVKILKAQGDLEAAYVTFEPVKNAVSYNVYCTKAGGNAVKLDAPLVREYKDYLRADAVGLAAGEYSLKVVPVDYQDNEVIASANQATTITVKAHTREGYAFVNAASGKSASGAYNDDGTLKSNARVIYVTNDNFKKVSVQAGSTTVTGIDNILGEGYQAKNGATDPLCIRIIGSLGAGDGTKTDFKANGDLELKALTQGVTVEGIGSDATANGWGMHITKCSYVEIRNLGFMNMMGDTKDGVGFESDCDHVWVHNCDFYYGHNWGGDQAKGDGALDTKSCSYVTHSYNHFWDSGKCNLQGMKSEKTDNKITYHHNWYDHSDSRHPRIRTCTTHIYNNYFDGNAKYGVGVTMGASAFVENNYFRSEAAMRPMMSSGQGTDAEGDGTFSGENGGIIKAFGNIYDCTKSNLKLLTQKNTAANNIDCYEAATRNETVPEDYTTKAGGTKYSNFDTASDFYKYSPDSAEDAKTNVTKYAGRIDGGDLKFTFDNATEDSNYAVIPELKAKLTSYKSSLVRVFGIEAATGGNTEGGDTEGEGGDTEGEGGTTTTTPIEGAWTFSGTGKAVTSKTTLSDPNNKITIVRSDADLSYKDVSVDIAGLGKSTCAVSTDSNSKGFSIKAGASEVSIVIYLSCTDSGTEAKACGLEITGAKASSGATAITKDDKYVAVNVTIAAGSTCTIKASGSRLNILAIAIN